jgi:hypothetical protein
MIRARRSHLVPRLVPPSQVGPTVGPTKRALPLRGVPLGPKWDLRGHDAAAIEEES